MQVTILLADDDALRRDGLASVLSGTDNFKIIAAVADGEAALAGIRSFTPDIAIIDLNLTGVNGTELVRRVRAEGFSTKIVIFAGTADEETIREVMHAGADGYLLKNGPARHLTDAISYVLDGGQYLSPQLRRNGLDTHPAAGTGARPARLRNPRRTNRLRNLRERIREETDPGLEDRDYEIMSMMADGIRPILDRLDDIDNRVGQMELGEAPVPTDPHAWLRTQFADTLRESRSSADSALPERGTGENPARLPELIEEAVAQRFHQMAGKLQQQVEETHVRTLETFVKNIQVKLVRRVAALEQDMSEQAQALRDLRDYSQRTEDNLSRLISGVDRLTQELPKRLAAATALQATAAGVVETPAPLPKPGSFPGGKRVARTLQLALAACVLMGIVIVVMNRVAKSKHAAPGPAVVQTSKLPAISTGSDTNTRMQAAGQYIDRKDYAMAEDIYKQVVHTDPRNVEALKGLASVLYREDKIDESASILDKLPKD